MPDPDQLYDTTSKLLERADQGDSKAAAQLSAGQQRIAYLLASAAKGRLLFTKTYGWLTWTGTHWSPDDGVGARNELFALLRTAARDANAETAKAAGQCMNDGPQRGVLNIASNLPEFNVTIEALDADPYLLNLANGTFDLRTFELRDHDPVDRLTRIARAAYDPDAQGPTWLDHLEYFQPKLEVREYMQRFFGYALLGKVTEHVLMICYGATGQNGKGTTDRIIQYALGDYATAANQNLLVATRASSADAASPARFALLGRRYVSMSETEKRVVIAEALMKNLTGGDMVTARALFKDEVVFEPSHTLCLWTNFKPKLSGDDGGVWRRVSLVPWEVKRPEKDKDSTIDDRLKLEADAILTWMLQGYKSWTEQGLNPPAIVRAATSEYQYEEDTTTQFLDEALIPDRAAITPAKEIWQAWEEFQHENQATPISQKDLYQRLENAGYTRARRASGYVFKGVAVRVDPESPSEELLNDEATG